MRKICHYAVSINLVSAGDIIFNPGEALVRPKMFFVNNGLLQYTSFSGRRFLISDGQWLSEQTLWTDWVHRGTLRALEDSRLRVLDASEFQVIVSQFQHVDTFDPRVYAQDFVAQLNNMPGEITDLPSQFHMDWTTAEKLHKRAEAANASVRELDLDLQVEDEDSDEDEAEKPAIGRKAVVLRAGTMMSNGSMSLRKSTQSEGIGPEASDTVVAGEALLGVPQPSKLNEGVRKLDKRLSQAFTGAVLAPPDIGNQVVAFSIEEEEV